jgi:hypothetical protein
MHLTAKRIAEKILVSEIDSTSSSKVDDDILNIGLRNIVETLTLTVVLVM